MASFGETLKRERELRNISLREVSEATKIGLRYLEALESNRFDQLPGGLFNKGFIRAYAKFIGLEAETLVNAYLFDIEHENDPEPAPPRFTGLRFEEDPAEVAAAAESKPLWSRPGLRIPLAVLGGLGLVAGLWWISSRAPSKGTPSEPASVPLSRAAAGKMVGPPLNGAEVPANLPSSEELATDVTPSDSLSEKIVPPPTPVLEPGSGTGAASKSIGELSSREVVPADIKDPEPESGAPALKESPAPAEKQEDKPEERKLASVPPPDSEIAESPAASRAQKIVPEKIEVAGESKTIPAPTPEAPPEQPLEAPNAQTPTSGSPASGKPMVLTVSTRVSASIHLFCDGKVKFDGNLPSGGSLPLLCTDGIRLSTTDAGATSLNIDGRSCLPLGENGRPLRDFPLDRNRVAEICPTSTGR